MSEELEKAEKKRLKKQEEVEKLGAEIASILATRELDREQIAKMRELDYRLEYRRRMLQEKMQTEDADLKIEVMTKVLGHIRSAPYKGSKIIIPNG